MTQVVKNYKVVLDPKITNKDKNLIVDLSDAFQFHDYRDLIDLRSEIYFDKLFQKENPTIDFEKYKFKPELTLEGIDFYFYQRLISDLTPVLYDDANPPVWTIIDNTYFVSSGFKAEDVPKSTRFLDSYFKFEFSLDPISQKTLFSVALPLDGTMLTPNDIPRPSVNFNQTIKTELEYIYWLRKPQQMLEVKTFTGGTFDLYCLVTFFNSKTNTATNFKITSDLPNSNLSSSQYTIRDRYLRYRLDYTNLTYKILDVNGTPFSNNRIKMYSI